MADAHAPSTIDRRPLLGLLLATALAFYGAVANRRQARHIAEASQGKADDAHGRGAAWPSEIPRRGWWDILMRVKDNNSRHNVSLIAAGMAFYTFLAIPSAITALVSLYGLIFDPRNVEAQVETMQGVLPGDVIKVLSDQLQAITSRPASTLGIGLVVSVMLAIWGARSATSSMITALNIIYEEPERRNFIWLQAISFGLTLGAVLFAFIALALIAVLPAVIHLLPLAAFGKTVTALIPWPILLVLVIVMLAAIYRYARRGKSRAGGGSAGAPFLLRHCGSSAPRFSRYMSANSPLTTRHTALSAPSSCCSSGFTCRLSLSCLVLN